MQEKSLSEMTDAQLLEEAMKIKSWMDIAKTKTAEINMELLNRAKFKEGSSTGHVYAENYHAKVTKKTTTTWDQDQLAIAKDRIGEAQFEAIFKREYKPRTKATLDKFYLTAPAEYADLVQKAMNKKISAPYVQIETLNEEL